MDIDKLIATTASIEAGETNRRRVTKSTYKEPRKTLPPIGTLLRIKKDCMVLMYDHEAGVKEGPAKAGDVGIVESHGAIIKGVARVARVRMFRTGELAGAAANSIDGERWERLDSRLEEVLP